MKMLLNMALENEKNIKKFKKEFEKEKAQLEAQMKETNKLIADEIKKQEQTKASIQR